MRYLISFVAAIVAFFIVGVGLDEAREPSPYRRNNDSDFVIIFLAGLSGLVTFGAGLYFSRPGRRTLGQMTSDSTSRILDMKDSVQARIEEREAKFLAQAEDEISRGQIDSGLWARALVNAGGKEEARKIEYMKLRARQIKRQSS